MPYCSHVSRPGWAGESPPGSTPQPEETDALVRSEASKHRHALASVITWVTLVVIHCVTGVAILARLGIPLTSLVAPAAVAAVALGFGAQRIVQDVLAGFFIITERQYGFGDLIRLSVPSLPDPAIGTVEDVTLRPTRRNSRSCAPNVVIEWTAPWRADRWLFCPSWMSRQDVMLDREGFLAAFWLPS